MDLAAPTRELDANAPGHRRPLFLALATVVAVLVGCGGGSVEVVAFMPEAVQAERVSYDLVTPELLTSCSTVGEVNDLDVLEDRVVFAGDFDVVIDGDGVRHQQANIAACTHDGKFLAFDHPVDGLVRVVAEYNNMLLVGGNFTVAGSSNESFAALDVATGQLLEFGPRQVKGSVHTVMISDSGSIYVGGAFNRVDGVSRTGLIRLGADGVFDSQFSPRLGRTDDEAQARVVYSVAEDSGRVYIGGDFGAINGEPVPGVGAVDADTGRITTGFSPDLTDANPDDGRVQVRSITVKDDWIYLCGDWSATEGRGDQDRQRNVGRFSRIGEADAGLEPWTDGAVRDCGFIGDDVLSVGGHFDVVSDEQWRKLVLVSVDTGEVMEVMGADSRRGVHVVGFNDGLLYIGGTFGEVQGVVQPGLAAIQIAEPIDSR